MPSRLEASFIDKDGSKKIPVMLHRAIVGSMERFIGILVEHYSGLMPLWLAPIQVVVLNIADAHSIYSKEIVESL